MQQSLEELTNALRGLVVGVPQVVLDWCRLRKVGTLGEGALRLCLAHVSTCLSSWRASGTPTVTLLRACLQG